MFEEQEDEAFDVCIIDADSLIYQIAYTTVSPKLAQKALDKAIDNIIETVVAKQAFVFIKGRDNFRFYADKDYKGNRVNNIEPEVKERIDKLYSYASKIAIPSHDGEADDYCAIVAAECAAESKTHVVAHIDKDLDMIPGVHFNFKKKLFYEMTIEEAYRFKIKQILMGDNTDNIKGLKGVGSKTADKLIADIPSENILSVACDAYKDVGNSDWKDSFTKCANCIIMRTTYADLRPLDYDELIKGLKWNKIMDTGLPLLKDLKVPLDLSMQSLVQQGDNTLVESN